MHAAESDLLGWLHFQFGCEAFAFRASTKWWLPSSALQLLSNPALVPTNVSTLLTPMLWSSCCLGPYVSVMSGSCFAPSGRVPLGRCGFGRGGDMGRRIAACSSQIRAVPLLCSRRRRISLLTLALVNICVHLCLGVALVQFCACAASVLCGHSCCSLYIPSPFTCGYSLGVGPRRS